MRKVAVCFPTAFPVAHLSHADRKLIFGQEKPNRRLYEIATLAVLRDRLRSADVWAEGSRSFRPINEHLMPRSKFNALKKASSISVCMETARPGLLKFSR